MPKIEVYREALFGSIGKALSTTELEDLLPVAKAELDDYDETEGIFKIELNDTNRPDLWSTGGLGRQLRSYLGGETSTYDFFSSGKFAQETGNRLIEVDPALENIRPFVAAFAVSGKAIDEVTLKDIIQTQEKLCWNYGQKRKSIAMGVYRSDLMTYPVRFSAADPDATRFVPLQMEAELSLRQILEQHPKGQEFGNIVEGFGQYPFLADSNGEVLSFPPIINSNHLGAVMVGDKNLFVEMTGTDLKAILLAVSIVACDMADAGFTILPVKTVYPYDTLYGREIVSPYYFQSNCRAHIDEINTMLGESFTVQEVSDFASKMGLRCTFDHESVTVAVPEYRNDFLHSVDLIEDIMIGRGTNEFEPIMPGDFTPGRLSNEELFCRRANDIMVGLGFQEMIYFYLGSKRDFIDRMNIDGTDVVHIANPMTENYEYVRNSILPCLLASESVSSNAVYPHRIFEIGKVAFLDEADNQGSITRNHLGILSADTDTDYNEVHATVSALLYYLSCDYSLEEAEDSRYIPGRCADIIYKGAKAGLFGELHPLVLDNWGIGVPCTACEVDLDSVLNR